MHHSISIHAPPRGATPASRSKRRRADFNSRPSARGDPRRNQQHRQERAISIHAPPRGATFSLVHCSSPHVFQFTPLREGRRLYRKGNCYFDDFNSRPSARGDLIMVPSLNAPMISIHAPPRGATDCCPKIQAIVVISIHAPPRGATTRT